MAADPPDRAAEPTKAPGGVFGAMMVHRAHVVDTWRRPARLGQPVTVEPFDPLPIPAVKA